MSLVLFVAVAAGAQEPTPRPTPPAGFQKAHFGESVKQVKAAYPDLQPAPVVAAGYLMHPGLQRQVLYARRLPGLNEPVDLELRFWKDRLWTILFYTGKNPQGDVDVYLQREYGPPATSENESVWIWPGRTLISQSARGWFALADKELGRDAQKELAGSRMSGATPGK